MRFDLSSGLPVRVSDDGNRRDPVRANETAARLRLKMIRVQYTQVSPLGHRMYGWTKAYANPFIHGSFLNWYRDDGAYDRTPERLRETEALYEAMGRQPSQQYEAIGLSVISTDDRAAELDD
jgi:hypothetical protein